MLYIFILYIVIRKLIIYILGLVLEEVSKTYLVHAVVCQQTKSTLPFHEAVQKGIIEKESGAYMDNVTGERMFVVDAINKGMQFFCKYLSKIFSRQFNVVHSTKSVHIECSEFVQLGIEPDFLLNFH